MTPQPWRCPTRTTSFEMKKKMEEEPWVSACRAGVLAGVQATLRDYVDIAWVPITPVEILVIYGHLECVAWVLSHGHGPRSSLYYARDARMITLLISRGACIHDVFDKRLHRAAMQHGWAVRQRETPLDRAFNSLARVACHCFIELGVVALALNKTGYKYRKRVLRARSACYCAAVTVLGVLRMRCVAIPYDIVRELSRHVWATRAYRAWEL